MHIIARHADGTTSTWQTSHTDWVSAKNDVIAEITNQTGAKPLCVLVRIK